ncbi:MAG: hypothetical protein P1U53_09505 [Sulfitobacter sp.]|nr:hypothetical protein [Sulfitobacter sp.]
MTLRSTLLAAGLTLLPVLASADGHTSEFVGEKGYVDEAFGEKGYVPPVAARPYHAPITHAPRKRAVKIVTLPPCPAGYTGMYRGNLYCVQGRLVH